MLVNEYFENTIQGRSTAIKGCNDARAWPLQACMSSPLIRASKSRRLRALLADVEWQARRPTAAAEFSTFVKMVSSRAAAGTRPKRVHEQRLSGRQLKGDAVKRNVKYKVILQRETRLPIFEMRGRSSGGRLAQRCSEGPPGGLKSHRQRPLARAPAKQQHAQFRRQYLRPVAIVSSAPRSE